MKKQFILASLLLVLLIQSNSKADEVPMASRIEVSIPKFSGGPDPFFIIEDQNDITTIYNKTSNLSSAENGIDSSCTLGGFSLQFYSKEKFIHSIRVCKGVLEFRSKQYFKDEKNLEDFLKNLAIHATWKDIFLEKK